MSFQLRNLHTDHIMSLSVKLEIIKGHGAAGDRVARVIFRGQLDFCFFFNFLFNLLGVSRVSKIFEQNEEVSVIGQV